MLAIAGEVFESARPLVQTDGRSSAVMMCLCAYLCHSLILQGHLESNLGPAFVTAVLGELLRCQQPLAQRVGCDLF